MTAVPPTLSYSSRLGGSCPLCRKRPLSAKRIYGHPVCKKCYNAFANRRQLAYLVDSLIFSVPVYLLFFGLGMVSAKQGMAPLGI